MSIFPEGTTHYNLTSVTPVMIWGGRVRIWLGDCWSVSVSNAEEMLTTNEVVPIKYIQLEQEVKELKAKLAKIEDMVSYRENNLSAIEDSDLLDNVADELKGNKQSLAEHDKQVAIEAIEELKHRIIECREMELSQGDVYTIDLIAEQFKQGFDVFETPDAV